MSLRHDYRHRPPEQVRGGVGATGYIGRFVVKELVDQGYQVIAFARERGGIGGRQSSEEVTADFPGAEVRFGDVTDPASIAAEAFDQPTDVVVSCLAPAPAAERIPGPLITQRPSTPTSRDGLPGWPTTCCSQPSACRSPAGIPEGEAGLRSRVASGRGDDPLHRSPTAFSKVWAARWKAAARGPYDVRGGTLASCKPISEADLARFMADCIHDEAKRNQVLPIGGPGPALSAREQGEMLFRA